MEYIGYFLAIIMGLSLGILGGGGSILTVPILVYFFRQDPLLATTGSLFVVGTTALIGAAINWKRGLINFKTGLLFALPSSIGVYFTRKILLPAIPDVVSLLGEFSITKSILVLISFAILMIFASRAMIKSGKSKSVPDRVDHQHSAISIGIKGFLVGCVTGFVGAGGGFLIIPALVILLHLPMKTAVGTSLAIIAINSIFGFVISISSHALDWTLLLAITAIGIAGLIFGQKLSGRFDESKLKKGFGYFILVVGSLILLEQLFKHTT